MGISTLVCRVFAAFFVWASFLAPASAGPTVTRLDSGGANTPLGQYYRNMEAGLLSQGGLRQDQGPSALDPAYLAESFREIALSREYGSRDAPLMRWEDPVRMTLRFGNSVPPSQRKDITRSIRSYAGRLERISGHPVQFGAAAPNYVVAVVDEAELRGLGPWLRANVPVISNRAVRAITAMPQGHMCMVVTVPQPDIRDGIRSAVAIVRAEHTPLMRQSCIEEELAQGMGLPNDCKGPRPSIFNDNEEYAVLTRHDELLLKALYAPELHSGMRREQALPLVERIFATSGS